MHSEGKQRRSQRTGGKKLEVAAGTEASLCDPYQVSELMIAELTIAAIAGQELPICEHLILHPTLHQQGKEAQARTLVDSGSPANFVSRAFANKHSVQRRSLRQTIPLRTVSGTPVGLRGIEERTEEVTLTINEHSEQISFYVIEIASFDLILGKPWLRTHNPDVDWEYDQIRFRGHCRQEHCEQRDPIEVLLLKAGDWIEEWTDDGEIVLAGLATPVNPKTLTHNIPEVYSDYSDLFSKEAANILPKHQPWDHVIPIEEGKQPPWGPIYGLNAIELEALRVYIEENVAKGFIRPSSSPAGAPILFVKKKDGSLRLCVDYRGLNNMTIKNRYALPLINELVDRFQNARVFTRLDLRGAYNLVRVAEGEEWKTAFRTRYGHYEYQVMPMGLTNAPASFQSLVNAKLAEFLDKTCVVYLDDIMIYSKNEEEHVKHVREILAKLWENNLYIKAEKCVFHSKEVEFLGVIVSDQGVRMDPAKVSAITEWPEPENLQQLQAFLGFVNFYRRFIPQFSALCKPLTDCTKKEETFAFPEAATQAFKEVKERFAIRENGILRYHDPERPTRIETDASNTAIGGCASQTDENGVSYPIAFYSRKLTKAEQNYEIYDKEMLGIIEALREWRAYLVGAKHPVEIVTDHKNLEYFTTTRKLNSRQARWNEFLGDYHFTIRYRPGSLNSRADALSRRADYRADPERSELSPPMLRPELIIGGLEDLRTQIQDRYSSDPSCRKGPQGRRYYEQGEDGLLRFKGRIVIPNHLELRKDILASCHDSPLAGHFGVAKTADLFSRDYYFPGYLKFVENYVLGCDKCQRSKVPRQKPLAIAEPLPVPQRPFGSIGMDFIVKLPPSRDAANPEGRVYDSVLVIVCRLTKYAEFIPCVEAMEAPEFARLFVNRFVANHGLPDDWTTDRGTLFVAKFTKAFAKISGIDPKASTAYHPQTDGQTERTNQILEQYLRTYCNYDQDDWVDLLPLAQFAYNNAKQTATKMTPFYASRGFHPRSNMDLKGDQSVPAASEQAERLQQIYRSLQLEVSNAQANMEKQMNARLVPHEFQVGDMVRLRRRHMKTQRPSDKLDDKMLGPFKILALIGKTAAKLELPETIEVHDVFHTSLLSPNRANEVQPTIPPPGPVFIKDKEEWEVEQVLATRKRGRNIWYKIRWKGFDTSNDSWEPMENLVNSEEIIKEFHERQAKRTARAKRSKKKKAPKLVQSETVQRDETDTVQRNESGTALASETNHRYATRSKDRT